MGFVRDLEGVEQRELRGLVDFNGKNVFEIGCGDGQITWQYAELAQHVFAFDPDETAIESARAQTPEALASKIEFGVGGLLDVRLEEGAFDIGLFAWSI